MQFCRYIIIVAFFIFGVSDLNAQENKVDSDRIIENMLENIETEEQDNEVIQDLYYFFDNPLNINEANSEELQRLYFLNSFQISNLQEYIEKRGNILSKYELQLVYGFDRDVIQSIEPFITFSLDSRSYDRNFSFENFFKYSNNQLLLRTQRGIEKTSGYKDITDDGIDNPKYLGSPYKYYAQYKNRYSDFLRFGVTMEKDYGEEFFKGYNRMGFDYYSGYVSLRNTNIFDALILGDYHVRFGQGLTVWSGFSFGKTPYVLDIMKSRTGFDEYSSANENQFFRGAAVSRTVGSAKVSAFYSKKAIDANLVKGKEERTFTSFQKSGYHRKLSEIEDKDAVLEKVTGGDVTFNLNRLKIGFSGIHYSYDAKRLHDTATNNIYDFRGREHMNLGLHYQFQLGKFYFFGEESTSAGESFAFLNGVRGNIAKGVSLSMLHRYYQPEYTAVYSGALSENSSNQNEEGWYLGLKTELVSDLTASMYVDVYRFPWLRFAADAPSNGYEYLIDLNYSIGDRGRLSARLKNGMKGKNFTHKISFVNPVYDENKQSYRLHFNYKISERFLLRNRISMSRYSQEKINESGWMVFQDLRYSVKNSPLKFDFRYAVFDTDSYKTRIYAYEHDLLYAFSIPAYYSKGFRTYLTAHYNRKKFDVWFKISRFFFADKEEIGSGTQTIYGNQKTDVKLQLMFKW